MTDNTELHTLFGKYNSWALANLESELFEYQIKAKEKQLQTGLNPYTKEIDYLTNLIMELKK